jgi:hypothetical protein
MPLFLQKPFLICHYAVLAARKLIIIMYD